MVNVANKTNDQTISYERDVYLCGVWIIVSAGDIWRLLLSTRLRLGRVNEWTQRAVHKSRDDDVAYSLYYYYVLAVIPGGRAVDHQN